MARGFKTGGREQGTPNKITGELRELLKTTLEGELNQVKKYFDSIDDPEKKLELLSRFLPYVVPKLNAVEMNADVNKVHQIEFVNVSKQFPDE
ncbi:MAG: hypothetical protein SVM86_05755 [Candidatus Cloacimonadota bacterium]|nr:hypothetical protein [Candidatus Cloacimonadota bacterium]